MIINIIVIAFLLLCYILVLMVVERIYTLLLDKGYIPWHSTRIGRLFVQRNYAISQHHSLSARKELKHFRKENRQKPFYVKLRKAGYILNSELMRFITDGTLEQNKIYTANTHLICRLRKAERLGYIEIKQADFHKERLLIEAIAFLSLIEIIKHKSHLRRKFFEVRFLIK